VQSAKFDEDLRRAVWLPHGAAKPWELTDALDLGRVLQGRLRSSFSFVGGLAPGATPPSNSRAILAPALLACLLGSRRAPGRRRIDLKIRPRRHAVRGDRLCLPYIPPSVGTCPGPCQPPPNLWRRGQELSRHLAGLGRSESFRFHDQQPRRPLGGRCVARARSPSVAVISVVLAVRYRGRLPCSRGRAGQLRGWTYLGLFPTTGTCPRRHALGIVRTGGVGILSCRAPGYAGVKLSSRSSPCEYHAK